MWYRHKGKSNQGGMMKKFAIVMCASTVFAGFAFGGTETYSSGKEMKQTAVQQAPCPEWYRDTEWNINLWGTYALTGNSWRNDTYLGVEHAWGGGGREELIFASDGDVIGARNDGSETKAVGQFGGGFEVRFTRAIGLMNDFSWNVVGGPKNNFGMVRSGITIAF